METRKFPGKLFLMGEYFVTNDYNQAIIMAVDRFIETKTRTSKKFRLTSDYGSIIEGQEVSVSMKLASGAVSLAYEYLAYLEVDCNKVNIKITTELLEDGVKVGLGSSAVILVAIIQSILESHQIYLNKLKLFKLSVLCQKRVGDLSSGGDLAASIFSGIVYYQKYDNQWLMDQSESFKILEEPWPGLMIKNLETPKNFEIIVAWTGQENKTDNYLKVFNQCQAEDLNTYEEFAQRAQRYVKMFVAGKYKDAFYNYRQLMLELEDWTKLNIETNALKQAIIISGDHYAAAKISGSGGGDCMVALLPHEYMDNKFSIIDGWRNANIKYLDIGVWENESITKKR